MKKDHLLPLLLGLPCPFLYFLFFSVNRQAGDLTTALLTMAAMISWSAAIILQEAKHSKIKRLYLVMTTAFSVVLVETGIWSGIWPAAPFCHRFIYLMVPLGGCAVTLYRQVFHRRLKYM